MIKCLLALLLTRLEARYIHLIIKEAWRTIIRWRSQHNRSSSTFFNSHASGVTNHICFYQSRMNTVYFETGIFTCYDSCLSVHCSFWYSICRYSYRRGVACSLFSLKSLKNHYTISSSRSTVRLSIFPSSAWAFSLPIYWNKKQ